VTKEDRYEQIERYLRQEMEPAERVAFETLLRTDATLKEEVTLHAGVHDLARREQFIQATASAGRDYFAEQPTQQQQPAGRSRMLYWSIAAAVMLLAVAGIFVVTSEKPTSGELFNEYYAHYEVPAVLRSDKPLYETPDAQESFMMYRERNYAAAIAGFSRALEQSPDDMLMTFCRGICYLTTGETGKAEEDLKVVIQHHDNLFVTQARWYLALTHVKSGNIAAARSVLITLDDPRAKELLQDLEE
jgi:hypothetical protein